jgi:hypothetical protein
MNEQNRIAVMTLLDAIYFGRISSCDDIEERMRQYAIYVGWLEGVLLAFCADDSFNDLMNCVRLKLKNDGISEEVTDLEEGSFY